MYKVEDIQADCISLNFPELYELRLKGEKGYLGMICAINRRITVEVPSLDGTVILEDRIEGLHCFECTERKRWIEQCKIALVDYLNSLEEKRDDSDVLQGD